MAIRLKGSRRAKVRPKIAAAAAAAATGLTSDPDQTSQERRHTPQELPQ